LAQLQPIARSNDAAAGDARKHLHVTKDVAFGEARQHSEMVKRGPKSTARKRKPHLSDNDGANGVARARQKLERKGADMIVMNDISRRDIGFDSDHNELTLVTSDREIGVSRRSKRACAAAIWDAAALPARTGAEPARA